MVKDPEQYWTVRDTAEYLGMKVQTIYNMVHTKRIPYHKIGLKSVRFKKNEIDKWVEENKKGQADTVKYVIIDDYPRRMYKNVSDTDKIEMYYTEKQVISNVFSTQQYLSGKHSIFWGPILDSKKECIKLIKNKIAIPSLMINGKRYFSVFNESLINNLLMIARVAHAGIERDKSDINISFYSILMEVVRRNAKEFKFSPGNKWPEAEKQYYIEDLSYSIVARLYEMALDFIKKEKREAQPEYVNEYIDFPSLLQAYALDYIYFYHNEYIDGYGDRQDECLILKKRSIEKISPSYISKGIDEQFFLKEEILEPLEKHIKDLETKVKELKKIVRDLKKKK